MKFCIQIIAAFGFMLLCSQNVLASVGKVIIAKGDVIAVDTNNASRVLKRRSEVLEGDTLVTGADSEIHIRFNDNAVLALRADSQLKISEYHEADGSQGEQVLMELLSGGFRTITGAFGKTDKAAYQIKTPAASIGIRGTNYEAIIQGDGLIVGVYHGGVSLNNNAGSINLGSDSAFNYAQVSSQNDSFVGLIEPPVELTQPLATSFKAPAADGSNSDGEESAQVVEDDGELTTQLSADESSAPEPSVDTSAVAPVTETVITSDTGGASEEDIANLSEQYDLASLHDLRLTQDQIIALKDNPSVGFVVLNEDPTGYRIASYPLLQTNEGLYPTVGTVSFDIEFDGKIYTIDIDSTSISSSADLLTAINSTINSQYTVNGVNASPITADFDGTSIVFKGVSDSDSQSIVINSFAGDVNFAMAMGLCDGSVTPCTGSYDLGSLTTGSLNHATHFGFIVDGENGPVYINYESESITNLNGDYITPDNVFKGNADATITDFTSLSTGSGDNVNVDWGYWDTSAANPALLLKDPDNLEGSEVIDHPYFFVQAVPAPMAKLSGTKNLSSVVEYHATSTSGSGMYDSLSTANFTASISVDFATAEAAGNINFSDTSANWSWDLNYYGQVNGAQFISDFGFGTFDDDTTTATTFVDAVGSVDGMFIDATTDVGFAGGFGMQATDDSASTQGVFVLE